MITRRSLFTLAAGAAVAPIVPLLPKPTPVMGSSVVAYRQAMKLFGSYDARASLKMFKYLKRVDQL